MKSLEDLIRKDKEPNFTTYSNSELLHVKSIFASPIEVYCPVTEMKEILYLTVIFKPNMYGVFIDFDSFAKFLNELSEDYLGYEGTCNLIYEKVSKKCKPFYLKVIVRNAKKEYYTQIAIRESNE